MGQKGKSMTEKSTDLTKVIDGELHLMNPADGQYYPVRDDRKRFLDSNKDVQKQAEELAFERDFEERRGLGTEKKISNEDEPFPGGVGYGSFFTSAYKGNYHTGTVIAADIICPQRAGGNVNTWLYLTETNRTAKGVEALIYYLGQSELGFKVFDWARDDHWQVTISSGSLKDYLTNKVIEGENRQVLSLQNQTFIIDTPGGKKWSNQVYLYNFKQNNYSLIYQYDYDATEQEQKSAWVGSWGPIVETFQDSYSGTNLLGFSYTYMQERDEHDNWTSFHLLTGDISYIRDDKKGFKVVFLHPNHSFGVN